MKTLPRPRRVVGFTLVELLTVIAIVGILAGMLIAGIGAIRESAKASRLTSNLRTVAEAIRLYANDNNGHTPPTRGGTPDGWQTRIKPYLLEENLQKNTSPESLLHDPTDDATFRNADGTTRYSANIALNGNSGFPYAAGGGFGPSEPPMGAANRLISTIAHPTRLMLITTGESQADAYVGFTMRIYGNAFKDAAAASKLTRIPGIHVVAFVDGHVEKIPQQRMLDEATLNTSGRSALFDWSANNGEGN